MANVQVIPLQWEEAVMAQLEGPGGVENGLAELCLEAHAPEGLYTDTTLV